MSWMAVIVKSASSVMPLCIDILSAYLKFLEAFDGESVF